MLVGKFVYVNGWECMVLKEGIGLTLDPDGNPLEFPAITIARTEGANVRGGLGIGHRFINDPDIFIPPSAFDYRFSEWNQAIDYPVPPTF